MPDSEAVSTDDLRVALDAVEGKKPTQRLMAAINYREEEGATMAEIAQRYGYTAGWLSRWLDRLDRLAEEPLEDVVYDDRRSGRPSALDPAERDRFVAAVQDGPRAAGFDAEAWTVSLVETYLDAAFDVEYSPRHVRRLLREAGLSPEPAPPDAAAGEGPGRATVWTS